LFASFSSHWREYVIDNIPRHFLHLWWDVPRHWNNYSVSYLVGRRIPYLLILVLALPPLLRTIVRLLRQPLATLRTSLPEVAALTLIATSTVPYSLFGSFHSRYRLPIELGLLLFASSAIGVTVANVRERWISFASKPAFVTRDG